MASKLGGGLRLMLKEMEDRWHDYMHGTASHRLAVHDGDKYGEGQVVKNGSGCTLRRGHLRHNSNPKECHPCQDSLTWSGTTPIWSVYRT